MKNRHSERVIAIPQFLCDLPAVQLASHDHSYLFGPKDGVIRRSTFEPRFWGPACDGRPATPTTRGRRAVEPWAPLAPGLEAGRGLRHSHKKMLQDEDIPDFAIEARSGSGFFIRLAAHAPVRPAAWPRLVPVSR